MATYMCYPRLMSGGWYANDAKTSGVSELRVLLLRNTGTAPSVASLRACTDMTAMLAVTNASEATFTGYTQGGKLVAPSDITFTDDFANRKRTLNIGGTYLWNPGGGATNNTLFCSVLAYRANNTIAAGSGYANWLTIAICTDSVGSAQLTYSTTFGSITATGPV